MKKKLFLPILLLSTIFNANAQKIIQGEMPNIKNENYINVTVDLSETKIDKMDIDMFLVSKSETMEDLRNTILSSFIGKANEELKNTGVLFAHEKLNKTSNYTIVIKPLIIDDDGENKTNYEIISNADKKSHCTLTLKSSGGRFGSALNLIHDGYVHAGERFGSYIKSIYKRQKKNKTYTDLFE